MANRAVLGALLVAFVGGLVIGSVGVAVMLGNSKPVGGGCTSTTGPVVCTSPHESTEFVAGALLAGVGPLIAGPAGSGLRSQGWQLPWQRAPPEGRILPRGACPGCGTPNPPESLFCGACGRATAAAAPPPLTDSS
jgi:hypothetical protein